MQHDYYLIQYVLNTLKWRGHFIHKVEDQKWMQHFGGQTNGKG